METHARFATIGLFALAVIAAAFGFVYWLRASGGFDRVAYRIRFEGPAYGVLAGSPVLFNGVRIGEVTGVGFDENDPSRTTVFVSVARAAPVRADSKVGIETQGFLGEPALSFSGGSGPPLRDAPNQPATLEAGETARDLSTVARGALQRFDSLIGDNASGVHETIDNLRTFTGALARNANRVDNILISLEKLGGGPSKPTAPVYDLAAPDMPRLDNVPSAQLSVSEPSAVVSLDTQKILYRSETGDTLPVDDGQWGDSIPKLFQTRVIQTFENADYMRVFRAMDGLAADHQLVLDLRRFDVSVAPARVATVEFTAKIVNDGKVSEGRMFRAAASVRGEGTKAAAVGLNDAFGEAAAALVRWVAAAIGRVEQPGGTASVSEPTKKEAADDVGSKDGR
jgi:phospholipid/cholesterol/gamma-HCH transport system substrate-binding protein